jgi:hypothetical protein
MEIPFIDDSLKRVPVPEFRGESILWQQNLELLIVKHNHSVEECPKPWTRAYEKSTFARIKRDYLEKKSVKGTLEELRG